jgi:hypothetical protein
MFKKFFSSTIFPILFITIGVGTILVGIWFPFESKLWKETWLSLGKTIFVSGAFAGILKLMQIHGVFMGELEKLIFEPKYLNNRKDIPSYWEKISQELFKNKFPAIRQKLLNDIKDTYLPTKEVIYYDKAEQNIDLTLDENDFLIMKRTTTINVVCTDGKKTEIMYEFTTMLSSKSEIEANVYSNTSITVNGENALGVVFDPLSKSGNNTLYRVKVPLNGCDEYELEREDTTKTKFISCEIVVFRAAKLTNTLSVTITYSNNIDVELIKMGTLDKFIPKHKEEAKNFQRYEYKGIIYKEQGYFIKITKK